MTNTNVVLRFSCFVSLYGWFYVTLEPYFFFLLVRVILLRLQMLTTNLKIYKTVALQFTTY